MKTADTQSLQSGTQWWLMLGLLLGSIPHFLVQPFWVSLIFILMLSWRALHLWRQWPVPSKQHKKLKWLHSALAVLIMSLVLARYGSTIGRDAGVALLIMMLGLKIVEIRTLRDIYVSCFLGYFLIITNFFYNQSISVLLLMILVVIIMTGCLISANSNDQVLKAKPRFKLATQMLVQALPLMLLLFVLFPRISGPLWGLPQDAHKGVTGIDNKMHLGSISELIQSDAIAFRVKFDGPMPPPSQRYWRGPVLWLTDGVTWTELPSWQQKKFSPQIKASGQVYHYSILLEPHNKHWLFALDMPINKPAQLSSYFTEDGQLHSEKRIRERVQYRLSSQTDYRFNPASEPYLKAALALPKNHFQRTRKLAETWHQQTPDNQAYIQRVLQYFHQNFTYTLTPPLATGDPVDDFMFNTKRGFCEHYAAAFTVMMRAAGIPTRIVTGYQGGEINPVDNMLVVRQRDAHAWTEVWQANRGWVRIDPTAAVSEQRVDEGINNMLPAERRAPTLIAHSHVLQELWQQLHYNWDALNSAWDLWILSYGPERQKELLQRLGMTHPDWQHMAGWLFGLLALVSSCLAFLILRQRKHAEPVVAAFNQFCRKLARVGIMHTSNEGPLDFSQRLQSSLPEQAEQIGEIMQLYIRIRYQQHTELLPEFQKRVNNFQAHRP